MKRARGYILLYVLGIMLVLSGMALSIAYRERIGFKLVLNQQDGLRREAALRGGLVYTAAQLEQTAKLAGLFDTDDPKVKGIERWRAGKSFAIPLGETALTVTLNQSQPPVDFNLLDEKMVARLFSSLGASKEQATQFTVQLLAAKPDAGFDSKEAVLASVTLPDAIRIGLPKEGQPGFADLIELGSHLAMIDLDRTPLPLIAAISDIPLDQLAPLAELRSKGPVQRDMAIKLLGDKLKVALPDAAALTAVVRMNDEPGWAEADFKQIQQHWQMGAVTYHLFETLPVAAKPDTVEVVETP